jgi:flagellar biosynthetic protein FliO
MNALTVSIKQWLETSSQKQKLMAALFAFSLVATVGLVIMKGSSGASDDPLQSSPLYFVGVFAKLVIVLLLILACSAIFRRWSQPVTSGRKLRQMQLIETVRLSPKQALHLVSIGDQQLLIGATDQNVSLITPVELSLDPLEEDVTHPAIRTDFASLLQTINFRSPAGSSSKS